MKRTLLALLCMLGVAQAAAATLTAERFTKEFVTALRAALPNAKVTVPKPLEVHVADAEGNQATAYLQNAFNEVTRDPSSKAAVIQRYVASIADAGSTPDWIKPANIVPVIKERAWLEEAARGRAQAGAIDAPAHIVEDFNEDLVIVYAEDTPRNTRYFSLKELEEAGVARKDLRGLALANLDRILPEVEFHAGENVSMLVAGADCVPSLLLIDELWRSGQVKADGDIVVAVPSRDMLLFTGSRNAKGIEELQKLARQVVEESSYSLTSQLFVYRDGRFQRFKP
jgi:uncharacterized protein YtpQ (UPF0354 family)